MPLYYQSVGIAFPSKNKQCCFVQLGPEDFGKICALVAGHEHLAYRMSYLAREFQLEPTLLFQEGSMSSIHKMNRTLNRENAASCLGFTT